MSLLAMLILFLDFVALTEDRFGIANSCRRYMQKNGGLYTLFFAETMIGGIVALFMLASKRRIVSPVIAALITVLSCFALAAPKQTRWCANYFAQERIRERHAIRLQGELNGLTDFKNVELRYCYWPYAKGEFLSVSSDVSDKFTCDKLVHRIDNADRWSIDWHVTVAGRDPSGRDANLGGEK